MSGKDLNKLPVVWTSRPSNAELAAVPGAHLLPRRGGKRKQSDSSAGNPNTGKSAKGNNGRKFDPTSVPKDKEEDKDLEAGTDPTLVRVYSKPGRLPLTAREFYQHSAVRNSRLSLGGADMKLYGTGAKHPAKFQAGWNWNCGLLSAHSKEAAALIVKDINKND